MRLELLDNLVWLESRLRDGDLTPSQRAAIEADILGAHRRAGEWDDGEWPEATDSIYNVDDSHFLNPTETPVVGLQTLEELLNRDKQRQEDGFPKKVILGKIASRGLLF